MTNLTDKLVSALYDVVDVAENYMDCDPESRLGEAVRAANEVLQAREAAKAQPVTDVLDGLTGYTPGPWTLAEAAGIGGTHRIRGHLGGESFIAAVSPQGLANARLIARAPALVDALRAIIEREARLREQKRAQRKAKKQSRRKS